MRGFATVDWALKREAFIATVLTAFLISYGYLYDIHSQAVCVAAMDRSAAAFCS
jgi:hypothetical protein